MTDRMVRIGTRGSQLALAQASLVRDDIHAMGLLAELVVIETAGDRVQDRPLQELGGKGLFTREIESVLIAGGIDLAIHSLKDLPYKMPDGLKLACFPAREDPRDVLICPMDNVHALTDLPLGSTVATGSLRRRAQLRRMRPDLQVIGIRGNVDTRLRKVQMGHDGMDATIVAAAGLRRLGLAVPGAISLECDQMLPAACQGLLGLQIREEDTALMTLLGPLNHVASAVAGEAERAFLQALKGDCNVPLAGHAFVSEASVSIRGLVCGPDGEPWHMDEVTAPVHQAAQAGEQLATQLLEQGAAEVLENCRG